MSLKKELVGYLGLPGSYTHQAAEELFEGAKLVGFGSIYEIVESAEKGEITMGVVPVENTIAGRVADLYQILDLIDLSIIGEHFVEIQHCLAVPEIDGEPAITDLARVSSVHSHRQGLMQCRKWLSENMPNAEPVITSDTASGANIVSADISASMATICSKRAAEIYGLHLAHENIQDHKQNFTRFHVLARRPAKAKDIAEEAITTVIFQVPHQPGSLLKALNAVAMHSVNVIKLETYMVSGLRAEPTFYVDIAVNRYSAVGEKALSDLVDKTSFLKVIGCYSASPLRDSVAGFLSVK